LQFRLDSSCSREPSWITFQHMHDMDANLMHRFFMRALESQPTIRVVSRGDWLS
jgi:hypothetical protein